VKQSHKTLLLWVLLIVMFLAIWNFLQPPERSRSVAFSEFVSQVQKGEVDEIQIKDREYRFRLHAAENAKAGAWKEAVGPVADQDVLNMLKPAAKENAPPAPKVYFEKEDTSPVWGNYLVTLLPMAFLGVMLFLFMRQLQAGGGKAMSFGKSKARMLSDSQNKVTFTRAPTRPRTRSRRSSPS